MLCPTHACATVQEAGRKRASTRSLATESLLGKGHGKAYSTANLLYWFRLDLGAVGVKLTGVRGEELWGLHAFRRGGAQALAAAGWSCTTIQAWARWESAVVSVYLAEAPLSASSTFATSIAGGMGVTFERGVGRHFLSEWLDGPARFAPATALASRLFKRTSSATPAWKEEAARAHSQERSSACKCIVCTLWSGTPQWCGSFGRPRCGPLDW